MIRKMKDSGIEWIGEIPKNWEITKLKYIFDIIGGNGFPEMLQGKTAGDYPFCKVSDINSDKNYVDTANNYITKEIAESKNFNIIPRYSILIAKIGEALKKNHRKINTVDCVIDNNMQAFTTIDDRKYCYYLLSSIDMLWFDNGGTVPSINNFKLKNSMVPKVAVCQQQKISNYLDQKVAKIDHIIDRTKLSIEEYKKYKQSLITVTATKGLNPNVEMKDSRIEWIGEIPEHWEIMHLNQIFAQVKNRNKDLKETNLLSLSYGKIIQKNINTNDGLLPENFEGYNIINTGNIVLRLTDLQNDHTSLRVGLCSQTGIITSAYISLYKKNKIDERYAYYYLHSFDIYKGFYGMGSGVRQGLTYDGIKSLKLLYPPIKDQQEIVTYLDEKCSEIDNVVVQKEKLLINLESYKKSLIFEFVTGKREV